MSVNDADDDNTASSVVLCMFGFMCCVCQDGCTPLHDVSYGGHFEVARLLLDRGANIEAIDEASVKDADDDNTASSVVCVCCVC